MKKIFIILTCTILLAGSLFGCTKADNIKENTDLHSLESIKDEDEY